MRRRPRGRTAPADRGLDRGSAGPVRALAAQVDLHDRAGARLGTVTAAQLVDPAFVARLAAVTGVAVTLLDSGASAARVTHTTESRDVRDAVLAAAVAVTGRAGHRDQRGPVRAPARALRRAAAAAGALRAQ